MCTRPDDSAPVPPVGVNVKPAAPKPAGEGLSEGSVVDFLLSMVKSSKRSSKHESSMSSSTDSDAFSSQSNSSETSTRKSSKRRSSKLGKGVENGEAILRRIYCRTHVLEVADQKVVDDALKATSFQGKTAAELQKIQLELEASLRNLKCLARYAPRCVQKLRRLFEEEIPARMQKLDEKADKSKDDSERARAKLGRELASLQTSASLAQYEALAVAEYSFTISKRKNLHRKALTGVKRQMQLPQVAAASNPVVVSAPVEAKPAETKPAEAKPTVPLAPVDDEAKEGAPAKTEAGKPAESSNFKKYLIYAFIALAVIAVIGLVVFLFNKSS